MAEETKPAPKQRAAELKPRRAGEGEGEREGRPKRRAWSLARPDPLTSLVLALPLFVVYHVGILFAHGRNGVDFVSNLITSVAHASTPLYLGIVGLVAAGLIGAAVVMGKKEHVAPRAFVPLLIESVVWAVVLFVVCGLTTAKLVGTGASPGAGGGAAGAQIGPQALGPIDMLVLAFGAGAHEELVFRVALFGGGTWVLRKWPLFPAVLAMPSAVVVSAILFSLVHYLGAEPFRLVTFVFRFLMGVGLALVYRYRGFAVAAWSHALYDVLIFLLMPHSV